MPDGRWGCSSIQFLEGVPAGPVRGDAVPLLVPDPAAPAPLDPHDPASWERAALSHPPPSFAVWHPMGGLNQNRPELPQNPNAKESSGSGSGGAGSRGRRPRGDTRVPSRQGGIRIPSPAVGAENPSWEGERWKEAHKVRSIPARLGTAPGRGAGRRSGGCSVLLSVCSHPATPLGDELRC